MKFSKKIVLGIIFSFIFGGGLMFIFITMPNIAINSKVESLSNSLVNQPIFPPPYIPDTVYFAGERVPIEYADVKESLERELLINAFWHSTTFLSFKRSNRYFPLMEKTLKANGVPTDFKYLAVVESGLSLTAGSSVGAKGIWQFMKKTAEEYGMEVNDFIDERLEIEKATSAAAKFLKAGYKVFGNWTLAAASYNRGKGGLSKAINHQKMTCFYDLLLNEETARYVYRIIAVKLIFENPERYGYSYNKSDLYPEVPLNYVEVDSAIKDLVGFAHKFSISYKILRIHNPWIRDKVLTNKTKKKYRIAIPKEGFYRKINDLIMPDSLFIQVDADEMDQAKDKKGSEE